MEVETFSEILWIGAKIFNQVCTSRPFPTDPDRPEPVTCNVTGPRHRFIRLARLATMGVYSNTSSQKLS